MRITKVNDGINSNSSMQKDVSIGVPAVIGKNGVEKIVELELNDEEKEWFNKGIDSVKNALSGVEF